MKKVFIKPIPEKTVVSEEIERIVLSLRQEHSLSLTDKVVWFLRRDNEPVLSSESMTHTLQSLRVADAPMTPHSPECNGTVERFMRSLWDAVRSILAGGVDPVLWDYAAEFAGDTWDRLPKTYGKLP